MGAWSRWVPVWVPVYSGGFQLVPAGSCLSLLSPTSCPSFLPDYLPCRLQAPAPDAEAIALERPFNKVQQLPIQVQSLNPSLCIIPSGATSLIELQLTQDFQHIDCKAWQYDGTTSNCVILGDLISEAHFPHPLNGNTSSRLLRLSQDNKWKSLNSV